MNLPLGTLLCVMSWVLSGCAHKPVEVVTGPKTLNPDLSLPGIMAQMEGHMNLLFRYIDDPDHGSELMEAASHLLQLQEAASTQWILNPEDEPESKRLQTLFVQRSNEAVDLIRDFIGFLESGRRSEAKRTLIKMDAHRRQCHVLFG